jgi:hypothetical protein|tara:strand:- start:2817 stop:3062 length:246 start_codon:yes stop_codon:yes gene_type:complete
MPTSEKVKEVKELRKIFKELEERISKFKDELSNTPSITVGEREAHHATLRYLSLAYTELESSRHWLGETLGALGVESEYKE